MSVFQHHWGRWVQDAESYKFVGETMTWRELMNGLQNFMLEAVSVESLFIRQSVFLCVLINFAHIERQSSY